MVSLELSQSRSTRNLNSGPGGELQIVDPDRISALSSIRRVKTPRSGTDTSLDAARIRRLAGTEDVRVEAAANIEARKSGKRTTTTPLNLTGTTGEEAAGGESAPQPVGSIPFNMTLGQGMGQGDSMGDWSGAHLCPSPHISPLLSRSTCVSFCPILFPTCLLLAATLAPLPYRRSTLPNSCATERPHPDCNCARACRCLLNAGLVTPPAVRAKALHDEALRVSAARLAAAQHQTETVVEVEEPLEPPTPPLSAAGGSRDAAAGEN